MILSCHCQHQLTPAWNKPDPTDPAGISTSWLWSVQQLWITWGKKLHCTVQFTPPIPSGLPITPAKWFFEAVATLNNYRHVLLNSILPLTFCVGGFKYAVCGTGIITAPFHGHIWCRLLKKNKKPLSFYQLSPEASKPLSISLLSLISNTAIGILFTWAFTSFAQSIRSLCVSFTLSHIHMDCFLFHKAI